MTVDPVHLIDRSIADLTQLAVILEAGVRAEAAIVSPELRACEEVVASIGTLIPRLKVARGARIAAEPLRRCQGCDE